MNNNRINIHFDDTIYSKLKHKRYYTVDTRTADYPVYDGKLVWYHISYGTMYLYKLLKVDDHNYIADHVATAWTCDPDWDNLLANPELAIN